MSPINSPITANGAKARTMRPTDGRGGVAVFSCLPSVFFFILAIEPAIGAPPCSNGKCATVREEDRSQPTRRTQPIDFRIVFAGTIVASDTRGFSRRLHGINSGCADHSDRINARACVRPHARTVGCIPYRRNPIHHRVGPRDPRERGNPYLREDPMSGKNSLLLYLATATYLAIGGAALHAQTFGVELHNTMMPASGGMAGASLTRPQDVPSALAGNPATLSDFKGCQFAFSGGWAEPTYNASYNGTVPALNLLGLTPFNAKSQTQGSSVFNVAMTQGLDAWGLPVTMGLGLITGSGLGTDFRAVPGSGGVSTEYLVLNGTSGVGVALTDRLSAGAGVQVGFGEFDGGFVENTSASHDYALRGNFGVNYQVLDRTSVGMFYQTPQSFTFDNSVLIAGRFLDVKIDNPANVGIGIANNALLDGRLLLAIDVLYKNYTSADFFGELFDDQWVYQFGTQYSLGGWRLRSGYAYNTNPVRANVGPQAGGIIPTAARSAVEYLQATTAGASSQHRITLGVGYVDFLICGLDLDLFGGGMFAEPQTYGGHSTSSAESYWLGAGITRRFGPGQ
jgi:long-chain fatty acid transport protein